MTKDILEKTVSKAEDLKCKKHPRSSFETIGTIKGSELERKLSVYQCKRCNDGKSIFPKTIAYDCPNCGIVYGDCGIEKSKTEKEEIDFLYCSVCDTKLGKYTPVKFESL